jgi:polyadenylate-binding protein
LTAIVNRNGKNIKEVDVSEPPVSNGYGFVCFQTAEDATKALAEGKVMAEGKELKLEAFKMKERNDPTKVSNNIYVKNFNPNWTEEVIRSTFARYGEIKSIAIMSKADKEGNQKSFAFVCYDRAGEHTYGYACAQAAIVDLHDKELDGYKLYVQAALPLEQRQAQVFREQQRFKNSKKKCNLFVKGFL